MKINLTDNLKMGCKQFNVDPFDTCQGRPCYTEGCYAQQGVRNPVTGATGPRYTACTKSWAQNYGAMMHHGERFVQTMIEKIKGLKHFRWFSAGDVPEDAENIVWRIMGATQFTKHLIFTKNIDAHRQIMDHPMTAHVMSYFSLWPVKGLNVGQYREVIATANMKQYAIVVPSKETVKQGPVWRFLKWCKERDYEAKVCPGACVKCGRWCWKPRTKKIKVVLFKAHGLHKNKISKGME